MEEVTQRTTEPLLQRRTEAAHPRTSGSAKGTVEVRPRRRRVAAQTKEGRTSPRDATLAEAAGNPPPTTSRDRTRTLPDSGGLGGYGKALALAAPPVAGSLAREGRRPAGRRVPHMPRPTQSRLSRSPAY